MTRARETADIIAKHLPEVPREECSMLREGAPIKPEPPAGHWKPDVKVENKLIAFLSFSLYRKAAHSVNVVEPFLRSLLWPVLCY